MDAEDTRILVHLCRQPGSTSMEVAKALFSPRSYSDGKVADRRVRGRLERLQEQGLVVSANSPRLWTLHPSRASQKVIHATDPLTHDVEKLGLALVVHLDGGILIAPLDPLT